MGTKLQPGKYDCYNNLAEDEPYFVLRGKDKFAPLLIMFWAQLVMLFGHSSEKIAEATKCAKSMQEWATKHGNKIPD